ncbi:MAG: hypothetical protein MHPSP_003295, partial [Paramarteilia canceri]
IDFESGSPAHLQVQGTTQDILPPDKLTNHSQQPSVELKCDARSENTADTNSKRRRWKLMKTFNVAE